jgi:adenylate cyclase
VHVGVATVGEIGVVKKDIVFSGDVLNTTSRIQEECNRHRVDLLASKDLLDRMPAGAPYRPVPIGQIPLRGREESVGLSAIEPSSLAGANSE